MFYVLMGYGFILYILLHKVGCLKNSAEKDFQFFQALTGCESLFFTSLLII